MGKRQKTGGRTKGTVNKTTKEIRVHYQNLVSENIEQLSDDLESLEPLQRIKMILELSKFVVPTLRSTELSTRGEKDFTPVVIRFDDPLPTARREDEKSNN